MSILYLCVVFGVVVALLACHRTLYQAMAGGILATILLFRIPPTQIIGKITGIFTNWSSLSILVSLYLITFLQRMLEARQLIKAAQHDLDGMFHNRRVNATLAPIFIGLLPSAAAMVLCGDIVKDSTDGYLSPKEQAFVTSWIRHIPESSLPTYTGVLLMSNLSGVPLPPFMCAMCVPILVLVLLGYWPYLHRIPKDPGTPPSDNRLRDAANLCKHLWMLMLIIILIIVFHLSVVPAVALVVALGVIVYRFSIRDLCSMARSAFEVKLLLNTFLVLVLKEFIAYTGVLGTLPDLLSKLPIPIWLVFSILFFLGGIISGSAGIIALGTPLAFAAIPGGVPLMVLLMCMSHAASQVSPIHICLVVAAEYYHITMGELIRKTIPASLAFCVLMMGYYQILLALGI